METLFVECLLLPDYVEFFAKRYITLFAEFGNEYTETFSAECRCQSEDCECFYKAEYRSLSKNYRDLLDLWRSTGLTEGFEVYDVVGLTLTLRISKENRNYENIQKQMETFVKDVLVPTTAKILTCEIRSYWSDITRKHAYTDMELRGNSMALPNIVRSLHHTWVDGAIAETRVVYKLGIPKYQQLDLERAFKG